ncbi:MAG: creatininase family protein [Prevotellaceae bacterium]|jgi:creatinine amidohydrolase|nr:creatininase family protein [Prevotellaceae bacterium]
MRSLLSITTLLLFVASLHAQPLSSAWEELTSSDFSLAVQQSKGVCLVPMGVLEKHGQHLPLGTDVFSAREECFRAAQKEYCIVFPFYFAGQIFEAQQQPGTIAYSPELLYQLLDQTCREIARNGIKKIILVNGHGGNNAFLQYFCQVQLATPRDYVVFAFSTSSDSETQKRIAALRKTDFDGHAGEVETSIILAIRPDLVKIDRAHDESGKDLSRLALKKEFPSLQTGIWWYAQFPNHYAGDAREANPEIGELSLESCSRSLAKLIKSVKEDQSALLLQDQFFKESLQPLQTKAKQ